MKTFLVLVIHLLCGLIQLTLSGRGCCGNVTELSYPTDFQKMPSSWNEYINTVMLESGYVSKGAIYGIDGKKWATSQGFELSKDDIMTLVQGFTDPIKLYTDGIRIGGRTFTCTRSDSGLIVGRESSAGHGCIVYRCNKCLVIAVHEDGAHPGGCHVTITKLGDYLRDQGI